MPDTQVDLTEFLTNENILEHHLMMCTSDEDPTGRGQREYPAVGPAFVTSPITSFLPSSYGYPQVTDMNLVGVFFPRGLSIQSIHQGSFER